jgi:hypothetical protein
MPYLNDEWGRYCDSAQAYVSTIASTLDTLGVHWASIVPSSRVAIGSGTLPTGWDSLPIVTAAPTTAAKYTVTVSGSTYYAKDANGNTLTSGSAAHTVINAAINALTSGRTTKEKVKLQGVFSLTSPILPTSYTILEVDGTVNWGNTGAGHMVYALNKSDIEITGGTWDGKRGTRTGIYSDGIPLYFEDCSDLLLSYMYIHSATYDAIECMNCDSVLIDTVEAGYCSWDAFMMAWCNDSQVDTCHIHDIDQGGCYFYCEDDSTAQTSNNNKVQNCLVERTLTSGISFSPRGAEDTVSGGYIQNNICVDCGTDGDHPAINVGFATKGQGVIVRDNNITCPAGLSGGGIEFGVDNGYCTGNTISGAGEAGISITGTGNSVTGNDVRNCGSQGYPNISLTGNNNTVTGNTIGQTPNAAINNTGTGNTTTPNTLVT